VASLFVIERDVVGGFIVDEASVRKLFSYIKREAQADVDVSITFKGGMTIRSRDVEGIFDDNFSTRDVIESIQLTSSCDRFKIRFNLKNYGSRPVDYYISGDRDVVIKIERELEIFVESIRAWYSNFVLEQYTVKLSLIIYILPISIIFMYISWKYLGSEIEKSFSFDYIIFFFAFSIFISPVMSFIFPTMVVNIGRGARVNGWRTKILYFIFSVILIGVVVSVLGNWATDWVARK